MATKAKYCVAFYKEFHAFIQQLQLLFPNDTDLAMAPAGIFMLEKTNPSLVIRETHTFLLPFETQIKNKDEDFILKHDFANHEKLTGMDSVIDKIKSLWLTITPDNKEIIWSYILVILMLARRYQESQ